MQISQLLAPGITFKQNPSVNNSENQKIATSPVKEKQPEADPKVKNGVLLTTIGGVLTGMAIVLKKGGYTINPAKMFKGPAKNWGITKVDYKEWEVIILAASSISGGLLGGHLFDKKDNMKAKLREAVIQMGGNILIPLGCVGGGARIYDKYYKEKVIKKFKLPKKKEGIPNMILAAVTLGLAIYLGNKTANFINEDIYKIRDDRTVKIADMSGHVDDTCMAISLADSESIISKTISRVIPLALLVCGYSSGVMQEWPEEKRLARKIDKNQLKK